MKLPRAIAVCVLAADSNYGVCDAQGSLSVLIENIHLCTLLDKKLDYRVDPLVSRSVQRSPLVLGNGIHIRSQFHEECGGIEHFLLLLIVPISAVWWTNTRRQVQRSSLAIG